MKKVFQGLVLPLGRGLRPRRRRHRTLVARGAIEQVYERAYDPSAMVNVWGLRLGVEGGVEGWLRAWRWDRSLTEIGSGSWRRWLSIRG